MAQVLPHPPIDAELLKRNVEKVQREVRAAAEDTGRRYEDITILAATKMQSAETINQAISFGIDHIGENRVQELVDKYDGYDKERAAVQFIGHLQANKVKYIVDKVSMIQSVDSVKLAAEINKQCAKIDKVMDILVEVNVGHEESKSGVYIEDLEKILPEIARFDHIHVRGLMTIPPICEDTERASHYFSILNKEFLDIKAKRLDNINMDFLSMGMSADFACAVRCGSNMVRVGTVLFGSRY